MADDVKRFFKGTVRATAKGFYGGAVRQEGEEFAFDGKLGSWMKPVTEEKPTEKVTTPSPVKA